MELDWDLQAVVRGCATTSSSATDLSYLSSFQPRDGDHFHFLSDPLFEATSTIDDLNDLFKPSKLNPLSPQNIPISPLSVLGGLQDLSPQLQQQKQKYPKQLFCGSTSANSTTHTTPTPRSKRRKNQLKRVCEVPAEGLSSDMWSWRKYGQKPIKGSPYPRGYYRCSTSKGCLARKQVERNRSDPGMFIVTYTAEHNHPIPTHRNSLAGSTRQKLGTDTAGDITHKPTCSSPSSLSPAATENAESREEREDSVEDEEEDELDFSDMVVGDDFFEGLDDLVAGDRFSGNSPAIQFSWLANNVTTTIAGGG